MSLYESHLCTRNVGPSIADHRRPHYIPLHPLLANRLAAPDNDTNSTLYCFTAYLECCRRVHSIGSIFDANLGAVLLFQPDVGWIAVLSGAFAIVWGLLRTGIAISTLRKLTHPFDRARKQGSFLKFDGSILHCYNLEVSFNLLSAQVVTRREP